jgi:microcystin-dependent protein
MNNNSYPVPSIDQLDWGAPLQLHLRQLIDPTTGGINIYEGSIPNTSLLKEGYTYIDTSTRAMKRWSGTEMKILLGGIAVLEVTPEEGEYNGQIIYNTTEQAILQWVVNPDPTEETGPGYWQYLVGGTNSGATDPAIWGFEPPISNNYFFKLDPNSAWVNPVIPSGKLYKWTGFEWEQLLTNVPFATTLTTQAGAAYLVVENTGNNKLFAVISNANKATLYQWVDSSSSWVALNNIATLVDVYPVNGNIPAGTVVTVPNRLLQDGYKFYNTTEQSLKVVKDGAWEVLLQGVNDSLLADIQEDIDVLKDEVQDILDGLRTELDALVGQLVKPGDLLPSASGVTTRTGYLLCDGAEYLITEYPALYAIIPRSWDNHPTLGMPAEGKFRVPDYQNRAIVGTSLTRLIGTYGGEETVALTANNNGPHTHTVTDPGHAHNYSRSNIIGDGERDNNRQFGDTYSTVPTSNSTTGITIATAGLGTPHNNMSPYATATIFIKT